MKTGLLCLVKSWLQRYFIISIVFAQKLTNKLLSINSESFIMAKIFQHCLAILFSLYMYSAALLIVMFFSLPKLLKMVLMNSPLPSVCRYLSFSLQALTYISQSLKTLKKSSLLQKSRIHDLHMNSSKNRPT